MNKLPSDDQISISVTAATAVLASGTEAEDDSAPPWRPDDKFASHCALRHHRPPQNPMGPWKAMGNGSRTRSLSPKPTSGRSMLASWRRIVDEPGAFPQGVWQLFSQSSLTASGSFVVSAGLRV